MNAVPGTVREIVENGLCIGCGLCEGITGGRVRMVATPQGSLRPDLSSPIIPEDAARILAGCPGVRSHPARPASADDDALWGSYVEARMAWAGDPDIRYRAASGGALTALGCHALADGIVAFVLHVSADLERPMRSVWKISETAAEVVAGMGSRYGPVAPLAGLETALERGVPFAVIAKPCDLTALHNAARADPRIDELCVLRMAMVCGGQSRLTKSTAVLEEYDVSEHELTLFRYRGYGNPGVLRVELGDGRAFEKTYGDLWADASGWELETRCKLCPDALGETADVVALDTWPGGDPVGEDEGFNAVVARTRVGHALVHGAAQSGRLTLGEPVSAETLTDFQPHQLRRKQRLTARYDGRADAGMPNLDVEGFRLDVLDNQLTEAQRTGERKGALDRARSGRFTETLVGDAE